MLLDFGEIAKGIKRTAYIRISQSEIMNTVLLAGIFKLLKWK